MSIVLLFSALLLLLFRPFLVLLLRSLKLLLLTRPLGGYSTHPMAHTA